MSTLTALESLQACPRDEAEVALASISRAATSRFPILAAIVGDPSAPFAARTLAARLVVPQLED